MTGYRTIFSIMLLIALTACRHFYPMGMSEGEWEDLTPLERAELRAQQSALDAARDIN